MIRFFVCESPSAVGLDLLKRRPYNSSEGLSQLMKAERSEWLMLNRKLTMPGTVSRFSHNFPARLEFITQDARMGVLDCQGLDKEEITDKVRTLVEALRDCKPQSVVELESLKLETPQRGLLRYLVKKGNIKDFAIPANF